MHATSNIPTSVARRNWLLTVSADLILVVAVVSFICFFQLDRPSISYRDETTHIRAVQEMRASGNWWLPTVRGHVYLNKPPFKMWLTSLPLAVFGESAFSYRFIDALCGVLTCVLLYFFGRRVFASRLAGIVAALALIGCESYVFGHGVRKAVQDSMLILLSTAALALGWLALDALREKNGRARAKRLALGSGLAIGFGILTKSAAGTLPLLIAGAYLLIERRLLKILKNDRGVVALLLVPALGIPALWYVPHLILTPGAAEVIFGQEIVARASEGYHNSGSFFFYFERLFADRAAFGPEVLVPSIGWALYAAVKGKSRLYRFLLSWALFPLLLFTCIPSRLTWYIAPGFPAMALLLGGTAAASFNSLRVPLRAWWREGKELSGKILLAAAFLAATAVSVPSSVSQNVSRLFTLKARHRFDLLTEDLVFLNASRPNGGRIVSFSAPNFSLHESTYGGMLERFTVRASSASETFKLIDAGSHGIVFTDLERFIALSEKRMPSAYRYFPPFYDRSEWLVVASYLEDFTGSELTPANRTIDFGPRRAAHHYGLGPGSVLGSVGVQPVLGAKASIPLSGDAALRRFGSTMSLNMLSNSRDPIELKIFLNEQEVYAKEMTRSDLRSASFLIPPGVWRKGENSFIIALRRLDGSPIEDEEALILLNWLNMKLGLRNE